MLVPERRTLLYPGGGPVSSYIHFLVLSLDLIELIKYRQIYTIYLQNVSEMIWNVSSA